MTDNLAHAANLASHLPGLLLEAERVAHTFMKGVHGRRRVGLGETFWQFRHYQQGDARRDIDWRQSAKRGAAFVRQMEWEASQTLWLYRDKSESMNFQSSRSFPLKKDFAEVLLLALAMVALNGGEQASLLGTDLAPQTGYHAIERIYETLATQTQLSEAGRPVASRSSAVLISDFYYPLDQMTAFCEKLALRGVQGCLVQVYDPAEETLPYKGRVKFHDMEDAQGAALTLPQVEAVRAEYERKYVAHHQALASAARSWGWHFSRFSTAERPETALSRLYDDLAVK